MICRKSDENDRDWSGGDPVKLSTRGQYALHAMVFLAQKAQEGPQTLRTIAEAGLPEQYLEQLLGALRRGGLVTTIRGAAGGYQIARPLEEITVASILESTEGPLNLSECATDQACCPKSSACITRDVWLYLTDNINSLLQGITLQDVLHNKPYGVKEHQSYEPRLS
jgi:Rrf2 family cysteine metabolism transcriptional repressor